ncbi:MAG TPA: exodeoxyribonuclease VII small subunit [Planctomycetota bacterium]|nr:exodeoxyribonuclease VII small subunit [Planctomycetota bacterium]
MPAKKKNSSEPGYGELAAELDEILSGIEEGEVDIDDLSLKVERATELIKVCREKLNATQIRVQKVVATLEEEEEEDEEWSDDDEADEEADDDESSDDEEADDTEEL